jgi:hypothetical protein
VDEFVISNHALSRALDMGMLPHEVRELLLKPQILRESKSAKHGQCWQFRRNGVAALAKRENGKYVVITVIPATAEEWKRRYPTGVSPDGRSFREEDW